ncbi:MAG: HAMP domain-containing sensor histidine kinase [Planctomycetota bacterium]
MNGAPPRDSLLVRAVTFTFVGLVVLPGLVLAWLGFQYAETLEQQTRSTIRRELDEELRRVRTDAAAELAEGTNRLTSHIAAAAARLARSLPFEDAGARFRPLPPLTIGGGRLHLVGEVVDAAGRPAGARPLRELPEWPAFLAAHATAQGAPTADDAAAVLARARAATVDPRLHARLHPPPIDPTPRTDLPAGEAALPHGARLLVRGRLEPRPAVSTGLHGIESTRELVRPGAPRPREQGVGTWWTSVPGDGLDMRIALHHPAAARVERDAAQRRWLTVGAIGMLLVLFVFGLWLVRRALAREQAARQLRDAFMANVSHELRTPLTSIRLHAEMLGETDLPAPKRSEYGRVVEAEGARLAALVDDMLDFTALERGARVLEIEPTDLVRAARAVVDSWRPVAARQGAEIHLDAQPASALADATSLARILHNLLQNALKYGGPHIEVRVRDDIEVRDDGPGVPVAERALIFERFRRGADAGHRPGAGIGLALSRELARAMDGELTCEDGEPGSRFRLRLQPVPETIA